ncbi:hypothetical protein GGS23DRAFT_324159 [Durotheca rogersii]|uniref:uncharacterized protein n=1 Tax=Durotheca rogersii TaxID=419775 RepID=UPI00221E41C6|nr:uncharacterized protein GGS23DRAFT_324159 [Durotheca rogersii]KAI5859361.1 hypothetical protein GGS23DRAFT_324159 [Durotheca rogersii]
MNMMASHETAIDDSEIEPLYLLSEDQNTHCRRQTGQRKKKGRLRFAYASLVAAYLVVVILYVILWVRLTKLESVAIEPKLFPSLARSSAFRQHNRVFPLTVVGTPFAGDPSTELDQAWHALLEGTTIRVSKEDLDYYNVTSLPLADGSGFASELFVTHELHCLKKIRQWIYKETYFTDVKEPARGELKRHIDHCIETVRQGIMCRGDVSLGTYTYLTGGSDVTARSWGSHQCVDFEALIAWTRERSLDIFKAGVLAKPEDIGREHFTERKPPT